MSAKRTLYLLTDADGHRCVAAHQKGGRIDVEGVDIVDGQPNRISGQILSLTFTPNASNDRRWIITIEMDE